MTEIEDLEERAEGEQAGVKICPSMSREPTHKIKLNKVLNIFIVEAGQSEKP